MAISDSLRADQRVYNQGIRNLNDGLSMASIAEGAITELSNIVTRIRELAEQASNGTLGTSQRKALDSEAQQLSKEFTRIVQTTTFNDQQLLNGSNQSYLLQAGYGTQAQLDSNFGGLIGNGTFTNNRSYVMEGYITGSIALGDLNGDGVLDMVSGGGTSGLAASMNIRLGNGNGSFGAAVSYTSPGSQAYELLLGDMNNDGVLDIVTGDYDAGTVSIRLGNGNGSFKSGVSSVFAASGTFSVALADLNNDGVLDVAANGQTASGVAGVRLGRGDGTLSTLTTYVETGATTSNGLALADFNSDGIIDMVTATTTGGASGYLSVRLGRGDGSFKTSTSYLVVSGFDARIQAADVNNDGVMDIIGSTTVNAVISLGRGDGTFAPSVSYSNGVSFTSRTAAVDFNSDGILDLVTVGDNAGTGGAMGLRLGNGDGTFRALTSFAPTSATYSQGFAFGDVNSDGVIDAVVGNQIMGSSLATVFLQNTNIGTAAVLPFSLKTAAEARQALAPLDNKIDLLANQRGAIGAIQSRISSAISTMNTTSENYAAAESQIRDADVAFETANLVRGRILQQAGAAILAQANKEPALAIKLLQTV